MVCFYEDSEDDMNVISEDGDLSDARDYLNYKRAKKVTECHKNGQQ